MINKKIIWITGASTGIGKDLAIKFANSGWHVAASARRENLLLDLNKINENISSFPLDVTNTDKCKEVVNKIINRFGTIDICVFCTGIHDPNSEKRFNLSKIREIMEVNFFGTMNSVNSIYDHFCEKKNGKIAIVSSVAGYRGLPAAGGYCASKSALTSFTESLYFDMRRKNVHVSLISPGFIKTPMTDKNDFKMPFLKTPEYAADQIYNGLINKNVFEIHFPKALTITLKILSFLPSKIYFGLIGKMTKYQKK